MSWLVFPDLLDMSHMTRADSRKLEFNPKNLNSFEEIGNISFVLYCSTIAFSDMDDDLRALISVERNIANIERSLSVSGNDGNGGTLTSDGAVVRNHHSHSEAARGLGKLFAGGRSSSLGRDIN